MWYPSRWVRLLVLALISVLILAACGGGGTTKSSGSPQGFVPVNQQQPTPTPTPAPRPTLEATPSPISTPDFLAIARANHCDVTNPTNTFPPGAGTSDYDEPWYQTKDSQIWSSTGTFTLLNFEGVKVPPNWFWFQGPNPIIVLSSGTPRISGHLMGRSSVTLTTSPSPSLDILSPQSHTQLPSHPVTLNFPKPGCWQISITSGSQTLAITAWAIPFNHRPDIAALNYQRNTFAPYQVPASCQVTNWAPPHPGMPRYAIVGHGATLFLYIPAFYAGYDQQINVTGDQSPEPKITGTLIGNSAAVVRSGSWVVNSDYFGGQAWQGKINFSTPGCWKVQVSAASGTVDATIYVYPSNCVHNTGGPIPSACSRPD